MNQKLPTVQLPNEDAETDFIADQLESMDEEYYG